MRAALQGELRALCFVTFVVRFESQQRAGTAERHTDDALVSRLTAWADKAATAYAREAAPAGDRSPA